jgi:hypothetical protein
LIRRAALAFALVLPLCSCARDEAPPGAGSERAAAAAERLEHLRALPYVDFAGAEGDTGADGIVRLDADLSWPGYTLSMSRTLCRADLMDASGRVMHAWSTSPCHHWANATILPGGDLLAVGMDPPADGGAQERLEERFLMRLGADSRVEWKIREGAHHDAQPAPGGRITAITAKHRREPAFDPERLLRDNYLAMLSAGGDVIEEISLWDLLSPGPAGFELKRAGVARAEKIGAVDLFHANTVHWMPHPGLEERGAIWSADNVMITVRNQDTVAILNWPRREVLWTWGRGELIGPHDATWLENGNILVLDNGLGRQWSRLVEVEPLTKTIVWEFTAPDRESFYSASRGGAQRLPNGNTLVTESDRGHAFEITSDGRVVWEFWNPNRNADGHRATIFRMRRYEPAAVAALIGAAGSSEAGSGADEAAVAGAEVR